MSDLNPFVIVYPNTQGRKGVRNYAHEQHTPNDDEAGRRPSSGSRGDALQVAVLQRRAKFLSSRSPSAIPASRSRSLDRTTRSEAPNETPAYGETT